MNVEFYLLHLQEKQQRLYQLRQLRQLLSLRESLLMKES
mgnify:CR=1 FL=1